MSDPTRQRLPTDQRRSQLLALGQRLFSERPYEDVSIDEIAAQAGISNGLLYHYFGSKRAFYVACLELAAEQLLEATALPEGPPSPERGAVQLLAFLDFVEARADAFVALFTGGAGHDDAVEAIIVRTRLAFVDRTIAHLGLPHDAPLVQLALRTWVAGVQHAALDWLATRQVPREQLVFTLLAALGGTLLAVDSVCEGTVLTPALRSQFLQQLAGRPQPVPL
jgi:AcrR family transcriptional regulator